MLSMSLIILQKYQILSKCFITSFNNEAQIFSLCNYVQYLDFYLCTIMKLKVVVLFKIDADVETRIIIIGCISL